MGFVTLIWDNRQSILVEFLLLVPMNYELFFPVFSCRLPQPKETQRMKQWKVVQLDFYSFDCEYSVFGPPKLADTNKKRVRGFIINSIDATFDTLVPLGKITEMTTPVTPVLRVWSLADWTDAKRSNFTAAKKLTPFILSTSELKCTFSRYLTIGDFALWNQGWCLRAHRSWLFWQMTTYCVKRRHSFSSNQHQRSFCSKFLLIFRYKVDEFFVFYRVLKFWHCE